MLFFPVNNRTWTCFHNLLNHPPIGDATVWCYCQLFTTTNNAALSRIIGSKSRNISNVKEILSSQKIAPVYTPTKCVVFPHHPTVCFHERLFLGLPTFSGQQLLSPLSRSSPHLSPLLLSLHTCSFSKQTPHDIIWPEESIVWRLLSLISSGKLTYLLVLSHIPGKKGAGTSLRQEWIQRLKLSLYLSYSWLCWSCLTTFSPPECSNRNYSCRQLQPHSSSSVTRDQAKGPSCDFPENNSRRWQARQEYLVFLDSSLGLKGLECDWQAHQNIME